MSDNDPVGQLRELVGADDDTLDSELQDYLDTAVELLGKYLGDNDVTLDDVPAVVLSRATRVVANELFNQDRAPNGYLNQQFAGDDGTESVAVRISTDPLRPAYALLKMWVPDRPSVPSPRGRFPAAAGYPDPASWR